MGHNRSRKERSPSRDICRRCARVRAALPETAKLCTPLRPRDLTTVFADEAIRVERAVLDKAKNPTSPAARHRGAEGLAEALGALRKPFVGADDLRFKFKLVGVQRSADVVTTSIDGYTGRLDVIVIAKGDVLLAIDLSQAILELVNHETRSAVLALPRPRIISPRLDHDRYGRRGL